MRLKLRVVISTKSFFDSDYSDNSYVLSNFTIWFVLRTPQQNHNRKINDKNNIEFELAF